MKNDLATHQDAKICLTASGALVHDHKILLVKHKKLGIWLCPGGHVEADEALHQAAEREFWEETGLKVEAVSALPVLAASPEFTHLPVPYRCSWHWVCHENYDLRLAGAKKSDLDPAQLKNWQKGCEQHVDYGFLVKPKIKGEAGLKFKQNIEESDGIAWFSEKELDELAADSPKQAALVAEFKEAFQVMAKMEAV